ncbi:hypothetical protein AAVH_29707, partial [Aphelenchoides avenae]
ANCLPTEVLLNIVHCVDYNTLVALSFTSHTIHSVVQSNAGILAKRLRMKLCIGDGRVSLSDRDGERCLKVCYAFGMPVTYVAA